MISALIRIIEWYPYCGALIEHLPPTHASRVPDGHRRTLTGPRIEAQRPSPRILRRQSVPHMDRTIQSRPARAGAPAAVDPPTSANVRRLTSAIAPLTTSWCSFARWISSSFRPACRSAERADVPTSQPRRAAVTARKPDVGLCARGDARNAQQADGAVIDRCWNAERWRQQEMGL